MSKLNTCLMNNTLFLVFSILGIQLSVAHTQPTSHHEFEHCRNSKKHYRHGNCERNEDYHPSICRRCCRPYWMNSEMKWKLAILKAEEDRIITRKEYNHLLQMEFASKRIRMRQHHCR